MPTLDRARDRYFQLFSQTKLPLQIISTWSQDEKLDFLLAIRGYFATREKAVSFMNHMPVQLAAQSHVISNLPDDANLFADAYAGGVRE